MHGWSWYNISTSKLLTLSACSAFWHLSRAAVSSKMIFLQVLLTLLQLQDQKEQRHNEHDKSDKLNALVKNRLHRSTSCALRSYLMRSMSPSRARILASTLFIFLDSSNKNMSTNSQPMCLPITRSSWWSSATFETTLQSYLRHRIHYWTAAKHRLPQMLWILLQQTLNVCVQKQPRFTKEFNKYKCTTCKSYFLFFW